MRKPWAANESVNYGIYVLTDGLGNFYVGQSIDIERRLVEHARDVAKKGFEVLARVAVPMLKNQAGKDILRIAEQAVMDAITDAGGNVNEGYNRAVGKKGRLFKPLQAIQGLCR